MSAERAFSPHQKRFAATVGFLNREEQFISMHTPLPTLASVIASHFRQNPTAKSIGAITVQKDTFVQFLCEVAAFASDAKLMEGAISRVRTATIQVEEMIFHKGDKVTAPADTPVLFAVLNTLQTTGKKQVGVTLREEQLTPLVGEIASLAHVPYDEMTPDVEEAIAFGKQQGIAVAERMAFKEAQRIREEAREKAPVPPTSAASEAEISAAPTQPEPSPAMVMLAPEKPEDNPAHLTRRRLRAEAQIPPAGTTTEPIDTPEKTKTRIPTIAATAPSSWQLAVIQSDPAMLALYEQIHTDASNILLDQQNRQRIQYLDHILTMTAGPVQLRNIGEAMRIDESTYPSLLQYFIAVYDTFRTFYYQPASIAQLAQAAYIGETPLRDYKKSLRLSLEEFDSDEPNLRIMATYFQVPLYTVIASLREYADRPETFGTLASAMHLHPTTLSEWVHKYGSPEQQLSEEDRAALQTIASRLNYLGFEGGNLTISLARAAFERYILQPREFAELAVALTDAKGSHKVNDAQDQVRTWQRRFNITLPEYPFDFITENVLRGLAMRMTNIPGHNPVSVDHALAEFRSFVLQPRLKTELAALLGLRVDRFIYFIDRFVTATMDPMLRDHERLYRDLAIRLNVTVDRARDELQQRVQQYASAHGGEYSNSALAAELGLNRGFLLESMKTLGIIS